ncbi:MAG: L-threonylcarbamoyladenylate synthase [Propionibacteriaceae bacterium]
MSAVEGHESDGSVPEPTTDQTAPDEPVSDEPDQDDPESASGSHAVDAPESEPEPAVQSQPDYLRFDCTTGDAADLAAATEAARVAIERGECIVLPTDTVYGIGADAFSALAVQRLLDAKIRGRDMPPPVLIADPGLIRVLAIEVPQTAKDLVAKHWPGPLTVILKVQPSLRLDLGEAEGTIALRVPDHELAREVLRQTGPMAVSSANISGLTATLTVDDAIEQLNDRVSVYLDGGPLGAGDPVPSTMVDFSQRDEGEVLRHGALSVEVLRETLPELDDLVESSVEESPADEEPATDSDQSSEVDDPLDGPYDPDEGSIGTETAASDSPETDTPDSFEPEAEARVGESPDPVAADAEIPDAEIPDAETHDAETHDAYTPERDTHDDESDPPEEAESDEASAEPEEFYLEDADEAKADRKISLSDTQRRSDPEA